MADSAQSVKSFYSIDEPAFWENCPPQFQHIKDRQGDIAYFFLGEDDDENPTTVIALKMEPGRVNVRHSHPCGRFEVVVQGSLDIGERILGPGDVMYSKPGVFYGPHVAGPEGCTTSRSSATCAAPTRSAWTTAATGRWNTTSPSPRCSRPTRPWTSTRSPVRSGVDRCVQPSGGGGHDRRGAPCVSWRHRARGRVLLRPRVRESCRSS